MKFHFLYVSLLYCSFSLFACQKDTDWFNPTGKEVFALYYQGMNASQVQAAKYMGDRGFISPTTGEHIVCTQSIDILPNVRVKPEIDEVLPAPKSRSWSTILKNPLLTLWQKSHEVISRFVNGTQGIQVNSTASSSLTHTIAGHSLVVSKINIAQEGDLANHERRLKSFNQEKSDALGFFMGVSRGAALTALALCRYHKQGYDLSKFRFAVHEGCFDSIEHVMRMRHPYLLKYDFCMNLVTKVATKIIAFKRDGPAPIKEIENYPKSMPAAFITSKKDIHVPAECTKEVVKALVKAGHPDVYLLELDNSSHIGYMRDCQKDKTKYRNFMHAMLQKHNLCHIPAYAQAGQALLEQAKKNAQALAS